MSTVVCATRGQMVAETAATVLRGAIDAGAIGQFTDDGPAARRGLKRGRNQRTVLADLPASSESAQIIQTGSTCRTGPETVSR